ncbi:MAG: hypothetical protein ACKV19_10840 [Verrucomicrobiales bacterium]
MKRWAEPHNAPMQLRVIDEHTVDLYQAATPYYGVESSQRFELRADDVIEMTFECIPRRKTWTHNPRKGHYNHENHEPH